VSICQPVVVEHDIRLLTLEGYRGNFLIKSALQRCLQPKSERLISKISNVSEHKREEDDEGPADKSFQSIPLSARVLTNEEQAPWAAPTDESGILQYALALSLTENPANNENTTAPAVPNIDQSDANSLYEEGDDGHVSQSHSTTNEVE
jgi:hypothetical protein